MDKIGGINRVEKIASHLMEDYSSLKEYEALKIAAEIDRNEILKAAFAVRKDVPSALEMIAMNMDK